MYEAYPYKSYDCKAFPKSLSLSNRGSFCTTLKKAINSSDLSLNTSAFDKLLGFANSTCSSKDIHIKFMLGLMATILFAIALLPPMRIIGDVTFLGFPM